MKIILTFLVICSFALAQTRISMPKDSEGIRSSKTPKKTRVKNRKTEIVPKKKKKGGTVTHMEAGVDIDKAPPIKISPK